MSPLTYPPCASQGHSYYTICYDMHIRKHTCIYLFHTPWCSVLLEKLNGCQPVKFPAFYGTRRFITAFTSGRHLSLYWANSIPSMPPHPTSWRSSFILSYHLRLGLSSGLFPSGFPTKTHRCIYVCINLYSEECNQRMSILYFPRNVQCFCYDAYCSLITAIIPESFRLPLNQKCSKLIHTPCTKRSLRIKKGRPNCFCSSNCVAQNKDTKTSRAIRVKHEASLHDYDAVHNTTSINRPEYVNYDSSTVCKRHWWQSGYKYVNKAAMQHLSTYKHCSQLVTPLLSQQTDFTMTLVRLQATNLPSHNTSTITDNQQTTPAHESFPSLPNSEFCTLKSHDVPICDNIRYSTSCANPLTV